MLSKAIFVATKESPQKIIAAFNAIYVLSSSFCIKPTPLIKKDRPVCKLRKANYHIKQRLYMYFSSVQDHLYKTILT